MFDLKYYFLYNYNETVLIKLNTSLATW